MTISDQQTEHLPAPLIAAAPELLTALQQTLAALDWVHPAPTHRPLSKQCKPCEARQAARAAITKATGGTP